MLKNYFKIAIRNLKRHKGYTFINIFGLAASLAVCLLVLLFIRQQWRYDRFHPSSDQLYRISMVMNGQNYAVSPQPFAPALRNGYSGVKAATRLVDGDAIVTVKSRSNKLEALWADSSFSHVFDGFKLAEGNWETALSRPYTVVLTQDAVKRLFPNQNPMGKTVRRWGEDAYTVTGIMAEPAGPTHLEFDGLFSYATLTADNDFNPVWRLRGGRQWTYLLLKESADPADLQNYITNLFSKKVPAEVAEDYTFHIQSLTDIQFGSMQWNEISTKAGVPDYVFWFLAILSLVLLAAVCFNYVNLSVVRSLHRTKEIGVRRSVGAHRGQVAFQFLCEAILMTLLATVLACIFLRGLIPLFNNLYTFTGLFDLPPLAFHPFGEPEVLLLIFGFGAIVGLLAGAYPAFVLSKFQPSRILSRQGNSPQKVLGSLSLRKVLLTAQFGITLILLITGITAYQQAAFMADTSSLKLDTERLISVEELQDVPYETFRRRAARLPGVESVSATNYLFLGPSSYSSYYIRSKQSEGRVNTYYYAVDSTFIRQMGISIAAALPNWKKRFDGGDIILVNETTSKMLGYDEPEKALGQPVTMGKDHFVIAGVVEDFFFGGSADILGSGNIRPMMLRYDSDRFRHGLVRVKKGYKMASVKQELKNIWEQLDTFYPFEARYYSDIRRMMYGPSKDVAYLIGFVSLLAILIACLGLIALAAYSVETKTKEIGIRKVHGASIWDVVRHYSKGFGALVLGAVAVAVPLAWLLNGRLLQLFAFGVELDPWVFIVSGIGLILLALGAIGSQTVRAAVANPVDSLRRE